VLHTGLTTELLERSDDRTGTKSVVVIPKIPLEARGNEPISRMTLALGPNSTSDFVEILQCDYVARKSFTRVSVDLSVDPPRIDKVEYTFDSMGTILCIALAFTTTPGERSFVLAGDTAGFVHMWEWAKSDPSEANNSHPEVHALRSWPIYEDEGVSIIEIGEIVIATGSTRGRVVLHSSLNFARLRTFSPVNDHMLHKVEHIILHGETLLWNVGSKVSCWRVGAATQELKGKVKTKGRHSPKVVSKWIGKWHVA